MSIEEWSNDTDRGKLKYTKINLSQCHFVHHTFRIDWPGIEPMTLPSVSSDQPPEPLHGPVLQAPFLVSSRCTNVTIHAQLLICKVAWHFNYSLRWYKETDAVHSSTPVSVCLTRVSKLLYGEHGSHCAKSSAWRLLQNRLASLQQFLRYFDECWSEELDTDGNIPERIQKCVKFWNRFI